MKKIIPALIAVALLGSAKVNAQSTDTAKMHGWGKKQLAGAMQIQVTYRKANLGTLNNALVKDGFAPLGHNDIWFNASMSHIHHKWLFEDGIGFTPITSSEENGIKAKYNQYQVYTRVAYNFSNDAAYRLYPFVGLNFSEAVLDIQDKPALNNTSDLSTEILNSTSSKTLYQPNLGIELGAGWDYVIKMKPKVTDCFTVQRNIPIGIRAGYYFNVAQGDWKVDGHSLTDGGEKKGAVFVSFNIGLGYEVNK